MKIRNFCLLLISLLVSTWAAQAQKTITLVNKLDKVNIQQGAKIQVFDDFELFSGIPTSGYELSKKINVRLNYTRKSQTDLSSQPDWEYTVKYRLTDLTSNTHHHGEVSVSFGNGSKAGRYIDLESYKLSYQRIALEVLEVKATHNGTAVSNPWSSSKIPSDIVLTAEVEEDQHTVLSSGAAIQLKWDANRNLISWGYVNGAEAYDIEWVFIDQKDTKYSTITTRAAAFGYKQGVRIQTPFNFYELDPIYPEGKLFVRVRAVGAFVKNTGNDYSLPKMGNWYSTNVVGGGDFTLFFKNVVTPSNHDVPAFEAGKNWTFQKSFIEGGKQKAVVSYFDGSLRSRQVNTKLSTDQTILTGEFYYDAEGRQALNVLPVPNVDASDLKYHPKFNKESDGSTIQAQDYAGSTNFKLSTSTGAGKYYSPYNGYTGDEKAFIPDAEGYPFVVTQYQRDGRSRTSKVSGAGKAFKMGSGRENTIDYLSVDDRDLRKLFGKNAGEREHYRKIISTDPNGQLTTTIQDLSGKTVASYLSGKKPANLLQLDGITPKVERYNIGSQKDYKLVNDVVKTTDAIFIEQPNTNYTFVFKSFTGSIFQHSFLSTNFCEYCSYDLRLWIEDPDGKRVDVELSNGSPVDEFKAAVPSIGQSLSSPLSVQNSTKIVATCSGSNAPYTVNDLEELKVLFYKKGTYRIHREIKINADQAEAKWQALLVAKKSVLDAKYQQFLTEERNSTDFSGCDNWCEQNPAECDKIAKGGTSSLISTGDGENDDLIDYASATCNSYYNQMLNDVAVVNGAEGNEFKRAAFWTRVANALSASGNSDIHGFTVTQLKLVGTWTNVAHAHLHDAWKAELVKSHREYCLYEDCISKGQKDWNNKRLELQYTIDWDDAVTKGLIYPVSNAVPSGITSVTGPGSLASGFPSSYTNQFVDGGLSSAEKTKIAFYLKNFAKVKDPNNASNSYVLTIYQYLSDAYQGIASGPGGPSGGIYTGLSIAQKKKRKWEEFFRYYSDIRRRVHYQNVIDNCTTIDIDQLNDTGEGCVFPPTPKHNPSGTFFLDLSKTYPNPINRVTLINDQSGNAFGNIYTNANQNYPGNFGCTEVCANNVKKWMSELKHFCPALFQSSNVQKRNDVETKLTAYCTSNCGSQSNATGVITGAIANNPGTSGPIYDISQILNGLGCSSALNELVEPTWNAAASAIQPCGEDNVMVELYKQIHNNRFNVTVNAPNEVIDYSSVIPLVSQIYDHFGGFPNNYVPAPNTDQGPFLKLYAHNNWKFIEWSQSCKDGSGNYLLNNVQYFTHTAPSQNANCGNAKTGCIVWALYDDRGSIVDAYGGIAGTPDPINFKSKLEIKKIEYYPNLPTTLQSNMPSKPVIDISGVRSSNGSDFIYRKLRIVYEATLLNGTKQERYAYVFGDKNCLSGDCYPKESPCKSILEAAAVAGAKARYKKYLNDLKESFLGTYYANCSKNVRDNIYYDKTVEDGYYTLYYYDQAGNLVQTVPPKGVDALDNASFPNQNQGRWNGTEPNHNYTTQYKYNGLNQVVEQYTPDAGKTQFYYNVKSQIRLSQNSQQAVMKKIVGGVNYYAYSYSEYDALGRVKAAGQLWGSLRKGSTDHSMKTLLSTELEELMKKTELTQIGANIAFASGTYSWKVYGKEQMVRTYYGDEVTSAPTCPISRDNTRSRVVASTFKHDLILATPQVNDYDAASHYSYDVLGNVKTLLQESKLLAKHGYPVNQNFKRVDYEYDYISGNVLKVAYQRGEVDQFFHKYEYDEDNRIRAAYTSKDEMIWDRDAKYKYYKHGPLQRVELGEDKVQGQDMAYTLQGWLKGTNSTLLAPEKDMAKDGIDKNNHIHKWTARDAYGYILGYYADDYKGIGNTQGFLAKANPLFVNHQRALYNGNIAYMTTAFMDLEEGLSKPVTAYAFQYDRLNRFKSSMDYNGKDLYVNGNNDWINAPQAALNYVPKVVYDPNGNIKELVRYADKGGVGTKMDDFSYKYLDETGADANNKLGYVTDAVADGVFTGIDLDNQSVNNYAYDNIGNLIKDDKENIQEIRWTVSGKVKEIIKKKDAKNLLQDIEFVYDASGNRVAKIVKPHVATGSTSADISKIDRWVTTHYVRDVSGNVMATYSDRSGMLAEHEKYPFVAFRVIGTTGTVHLTTSNGQTIINTGISGAVSPEDVAKQIVAAIGLPFVAGAEGDVVRIYYKAGAPFGNQISLIDNQNSVSIEMITDKVFKAGSSDPGASAKYKQLALDEHHIYGSSRLGMKSRKQAVASTFINTSQSQGEYGIESISTNYNQPLYASASKNAFDRTVSHKQYELANHLGNVNAVISDKKLLKSDGGKHYVKNTDFTTWGGIKHNWVGSNAQLIRDNGRLKVSSTQQWAGVEQFIESTKGRVYRVSFDLDLGDITQANVYVRDVISNSNYSSMNCTNSGHYEFLVASYSTQTGVRVERDDATNATAKNFYLDNFMVEELEMTNETEEIGLPESKWVTAQQTGVFQVQNDPGSFTWSIEKYYDRKERRLQTQTGAYYAIRAKVSSPTNSKFYFSIWDNVNGVGRKYQNAGYTRGEYLMPFKATSNLNSLVIWNISPTVTSIPPTLRKFKVEGIQLIKLKRKGIIVEQSFNDFDGWISDPYGKGELSLSNNQLKLEVKDIDHNGSAWRSIQKKIKTTPGKFYRIKFDTDLEALAGNLHNKFVFNVDNNQVALFSGMQKIAEGGFIFQAKEKITTLLLGADFKPNTSGNAETRTFYLDNIEICEMEKVAGTTQHIDNSGWTTLGNATIATPAGNNTKLTITGGNWKGAKKSIDNLVTKGKYYVVESLISRQTAGKRIGVYFDHGSGFKKDYHDYHTTLDVQLPFGFYSLDGAEEVSFLGREVSGSVTFSVDHIKLRELRKGKVLSFSRFNNGRHVDQIADFSRPSSIFVKNGTPELKNENGRLKVKVTENTHGVDKRIKTVPGKFYKVKFDLDILDISAYRFSLTIFDEGNYGEPIHYLTKLSKTHEVLFQARKKSTILNFEILGLPNPAIPNQPSVTYLLDNVKISEMMPVAGSFQSVGTLGWVKHDIGSANNVTVSALSNGVQANVIEFGDGAKKDISNLISSGRYYAITADCTPSNQSIGIDVKSTGGIHYDKHFKNNNLNQGIAFKADGTNTSLIYNSRVNGNITLKAQNIGLIELQEDRVLEVYDFELNQLGYNMYNAPDVVYDNTSKRVRIKTPHIYHGIQHSFKTEKDKDYLLSFDASLFNGTTVSAALVYYANKNVTGGWQLIKAKPISQNGRHHIRFKAKSDHAFIVWERNNASTPSGATNYYFELKDFEVVDLENLYNFNDFEGVNDFVPQNSAQGPPSTLSLDYGGKLKVGVTGQYGGTTYTFDTEPGTKYTVRYDLGQGTVNTITTAIRDGVSHVNYLVENTTASKTIVHTFTAQSAKSIVLIEKASSNQTAQYFTIDNLVIENSSTFKGYFADVLSYNDYFPFGMHMPNRNGNANSYRYGFQGQEKDDEVKGSGSSVNYKFRMHDARIGRFFAVDPLTSKYPFYSPYAFSGNRVIDMIELEGAEPKEPKYKWTPTDISSYGHGTMMKVEGYWVFVSLDNEADAVHKYFNPTNNKWESFSPASPKCISCEIEGAMKILVKPIYNNTDVTAEVTVQIGTGEADVNRVMGVNFAGSGMKSTLSATVFKLEGIKGLKAYVKGEDFSKYITAPLDFKAEYKNAKRDREVHANIGFSPRSLKLSGELGGSYRMVGLNFKGEADFSKFSLSKPMKSTSFTGDVELGLSFLDFSKTVSKGGLSLSPKAKAPTADGPLSTIYNFKYEVKFSFKGFFRDANKYWFGNN